MNSFLYVMVGPIPLLLAGDSVYEILSMDANAGAGGHHQWRNTLLPIVSANDLLELTPLAKSAELTGVVYRCYKEKPPIVLLVTRVMRLLSLHSSEFEPLPAVPEKVHRLFDGVYLDQREAKQVYRFRTQLAQETLSQQTQAQIE